MPPGREESVGFADLLNSVIMSFNNMKFNNNSVWKISEIKEGCEVLPWGACDIQAISSLSGTYSPNMSPRRSNNSHCKWPSLKRTSLSTHQSSLRVQRRQRACRRIRMDAMECCLLGVNRLLSSWITAAVLTCKGLEEVKPGETPPLKPEEGECGHC